MRPARTVPPGASNRVTPRARIDPPGPHPRGALLAPPLVFSSLCALLLACGTGNGKGKDTGAGDGGEKVILFITTEMKGTIEPCGCNSDPLGDIARTIALVEQARRGPTPVVVVDGGSLLFTEPRVSGEKAAPERLKAEFLIGMFRDRLAAAAIGLGPFDLSMGPAAVQPPRQAANLRPGSGVATEPPKLVQAGRVKIGIFGVVAIGALGDGTLQIDDPVPVARAAVADLRKRGADVIVALAHMTRKDARDLARKASGIDLVVVGQNAPANPARLVEAPEQVDGAWLVQPADRGQVVSRIDVTLRAGGGSGPRLVDAIGESRAQVELVSLARQAADLTAELARWKKEAGADRAFVAEKEKELAAIAAEREQLRTTPLRIPEHGSWFTLSQVRVRKRLACDSKVVAAKTEVDRLSGQASLEAVKKAGPPPAPPAGKPKYVGIEECESCHQAAVDFWRKTVHARAWKTLTDLGKDRSFDCVGCHVTGWDEPGGSNLAFNEPLRDVQCEVCHGPASLHVDANGKEKVSSLVRKTPEDRCKGCHSEDHSDTFQYDAYLRDVTGPGHGQALRAQLGDGPTGHALRAAALEKAGRELGPGCQK